MIAIDASPATPLIQPRAVVDDVGEDDDACHRQHHIDQARQPRRHRRPGNAANVRLAGFKMHDVEEADVRNDRRQRRVLDDLRVGDADVLDHQEGGSAHHRRH